MADGRGITVRTVRDAGALSLVLLALLLPAAASAEVYKFVDPDGRVTYTDTRHQPAWMKLVKTWKGWALPRTSTAALKSGRKQFTDTIASAAREQGLPEALVHAVVSAESAYRPDAVSRAGAVGLMQLMPETAKRYGVTDRTDPEQNVRGGTRYLRDLLEMFDNDTTLAIAAYNAGEGAVQKYGNTIPPYAETQEYVRRVKAYYAQFSGEQGTASAKPAPAADTAATAQEPPGGKRRPVAVIEWSR
ncbi:lytic transglycosylase domain-containing protein [Thioalbus denitrificans]|uniref:Uncharacterized protein DUF4124 n=1 Tax=Thioalbus denitrificans TaxID=547122 RepID=A0A369CCY8_9GAMM|nr:lytic transglycosylase domain-containing protein [Thioalbus denitrificans]RCX30596.1 uncharacterized protein DUF4124 [Thioalbus denitrificans]